MLGFIHVEVRVLAGTLFVESIRSRAQGDEENGSSVIQSVFSYRTRTSVLYDEVLLLRRRGLNCVLK